MAKDSSKLLMPNHTQIPNIILDKVMHRLSGSEFKCLMYICRRTFGFHKKKDRIAFSQFIDGITGENGEKIDGGTGLSRQSLTDALDVLVSSGLVKKLSDSKGNFYEINIHCDLIEVVKKIDQSKNQTSESGLKNRPKWSKNQTDIGLKNRLTKERKENRKKDIISATAEMPWDFKKYLNVMFENKREDIQIIAMFFKEKGLEFDSKTECDMAIKEHLRVAGELAKLDSNKVMRAVDEAKNEYKDIWKLSTVKKIITSRKV